MSDDKWRIIDRLLTAAIRAGASAADVFIVEKETSTTSCRLGKIESVKRGETTRLLLRIFIGPRTASISSTNLEWQTLLVLLDRAISMAKRAPKNRFSGLPDNCSLANDDPHLDLVDPQEINYAELEGRALAAEASGLATKGITNSQGAHASHSRERVWLGSSAGFLRHYQTTESEIGVSFVAKGKDSMEREKSRTRARHVSDLKKPEELGRKTAIKALKRLNPRKVRSREVPVIFDPRVSHTLLRHFSAAISGTAVARGASFLKDLMHTQVFGGGINIIDDARMLRGLRSKPCDDEGCRNARCMLVLNGRLINWILDSASSRQLNLKTTGHATRGVSAFGPPAASNIYIENGKLTSRDLMLGIKDGFYVTELLGGTVSSVTGNYSRGAAGFWISNGISTFPVAEVTIAGNLSDIYRDLTAADDLELIRGFDAPTCRVDHMVVSGT